MNQQGLYNALSVEDLTEIAKDFIQQIPVHSIVCFQAEMGAGKTTLIQEILKHLGVSHPKGSPTYSIINEYLTEKNGIIYHLDLYRIKESEELYDIGFEDIIYGNHYAFIEWPERAGDFLPDERIDVSITIQENGSREISWKMESDNLI